MDSFYRSIWISDIHLGTRECQAEALLEFLRMTESEYLYLVGDIIDGQRLSQSWYWMQSHNDVIQKLLRKARKGTKVVYIPGNHDRWLRDYSQMKLGGIALVNEAVHTTVEGRRMLVLHGDAFDDQIRLTKWRAQLGEWAYDRMLSLDHRYNLVRTRLGYPHWSVSRFLKSRIKEAVDHVRNFEQAAARETSRRGLDGIVCGHIHTPGMREITGILYCNDGDWVENCTALVERQDGALDLIAWSGRQQRHVPNPIKQDERVFARAKIDAA